MKCYKHHTKCFYSLRTCTKLIGGAFLPKGIQQIIQPGTHPCALKLLVFWKERTMGGCVSPESTIVCGFAWKNGSTSDPKCHGWFEAQVDLGN
eukprot:scaffold1519_cov166-Amphora_coffeaeformis.AAC.4